MKKNLFKVLLSAVMALSLIANANVAAYAADNEIQGTGSDGQKTQTVEVTANITSVYSVSLPAAISLSYDVVNDVTIDGNLISEDTEVYIGTITYGCAGKISSNQSVYINASFPCSLTGTNSGETVALKQILGSDGAAIKSTWSSTEIGDCTFDGVTVSNCDYATVDMQVGFKVSDLVTFDNYSGALTFNFGITTN